MQFFTVVFRSLVTLTVLLALSSHGISASADSREVPNPPPNPNITPTLSSTHTDLTRNGIAKRRADAVKETAAAIKARKGGSGVGKGGKGGGRVASGHSSAPTISGNYLVPLGVLGVVWMVSWLS